MPRLPHEATRTARRQGTSVLLGLAVVGGLLVLPEPSLRLFWNLAIPILPALVTLWPGLWRNVCPLGSAAALTQRVAPGGGRRLSLEGQGVATLGSVLLLAAILPLRRLGLDVDGRSTALLLVAAGIAAIGLASRFSGKSGWCATLCPVNAVERLYGQAPVGEGRNLHCSSCSHCVAVCPDSVRSMAPLRATPTTWQRLADTLMAGGFLGFVWGWFHVAPRSGELLAMEIARAYLLPLTAGAASLALFLVARRLAPRNRRSDVVRAFAAATLACYYWYRLPALLGFGLFAGDGVLVDLSTTAPATLPLACRAGVLAAIALHWRLTRRDPKAWLTRPTTPARLVTIGAGPRVGTDYRTAA